LLPEGTDELGAALHALQRAAAEKPEFGQVVGTAVGQFVMWPITPQIFHRVQFRRVARQPLDGEAVPLGTDAAATPTSTAPSFGRSALVAISFSMIS
jgi:hypothetical protein